MCVTGRTRRSVVAANVTLLVAHETTPTSCWRHDALSDDDGEQLSSRAYNTMLALDCGIRDRDNIPSYCSVGDTMLMLSRAARAR